MILKALKKIYPSKSDKFLENMGKDIEKYTNQGVNISELADSTVNFIMTYTVEEDLKSIKEDDLRPTLLVDESSSFNVLKENEKTNNKNSENTTEFPKTN